MTSTGSTRLAAIGDNCIDVYEALGLRLAGGNAVNVAVNWARAGFGSAYLGAVGADPDGDQICAAVAAQGVDVSRVRTLMGRTGVTQIELLGDGERLLAQEDFGVSADYGPDQDDLDALAGCALVHCAGLTDFRDAVGGLAERGLRTSYDFSTRHVLDDLDGIDVAFYSWEREPDAGARALLRRALDAGAQVAVATCGRHGALAARGDDLVVVPAHPVTVVDTCGAGDAFIAAFLAEHVAEQPLRHCAEVATGAAASCCEQLGAWPQPAARERSEPDVVR